MLALESSRQQQFPFFSQDQLALDPELMDSYGFSAMQPNLQSQNHEHIHSYPQQTYYESSSSWTDQTPDMEFQQKSQQHMLYPGGGANSPLSMVASHYSAASGASVASASSSAMGSPYSGAAHTFQDSWMDGANGLLGMPMGMMPEIDYPLASMEGDATFGAGTKYPTVDPSAIHHPLHTPMPYDDQVNMSHSSGFVSPAQIGSPMPSHQNLGLPQPQMNTSSPYLGVQHVRSSSVAGYERPSSIISSLSPRSHPSPAASNTDVEDEGREKRRCPWPDCGRSFKDLKAHMLTHQSERPEKCPIVNCEYHLKGFARKYDKNRHTLTHYKGTMVCGFCPGSGSAAEKSFNRADVFKRHLMSVHGVEQTAPNCRKRSPTSSSVEHQKLLPGYSEDATGKCSTCSATFSNAQDFYEHLDDCVLRVVQQEEPSEAINQKRLAEVANDEDVKLTMEKHQLLDTASSMANADEYNDDNDDTYEADDADESNINTLNNKASGKGAITKSNSQRSSSSRAVLGANSAVSKHNNKPRAITRRRGNRNSYPHSWGTPMAKMKTKKRVLCAYDGPRRLWKDEMMLDNEFEVRIALPGGAGDGTNRNAYVTDLDMVSLKRVEGIFSATEEERGPAMPNTTTSNRLMGQPAMILPEVTQEDYGFDIDELMAYKEPYAGNRQDGLCV
ncbi:C2H2 finger domain protein, putative, partial [Talaromyces stipitatus ATCC 10500]